MPGENSTPAGTAAGAGNVAPADSAIAIAVDEAMKRRGLVSHDWAAEYLDVSPATLHAWNHKRVGPRSYKLGKHRKYRVSDLDAFVEGRASQPRSA